MLWAQVFGYCMFKDGNEAKIGYPTEGHVGEVAGRSFHNGAHSLMSSQHLLTLCHSPCPECDLVSQIWCIALAVL